MFRGDMKLNIDQLTSILETCFGLGNSNGLVYFYSSYATDAHEDNMDETKTIVLAYDSEFSDTYELDATDVHVTENGTLFFSKDNEYFTVLSAVSESDVLKMADGTFL